MKKRIWEIKSHYLFICIFLLGVIPQVVLAQSVDSLLNRFIYQVHRAYEQAGALSFQLHYYYANQAQPEKYIDSISGDVQLAGNRARLHIDGMVTIKTAGYDIQIRQDERSMFVMQEKKDNLISSMIFLDSALAHIHGIRTSRTENKRQETIIVFFSGGQTYRRIMMTRDKESGFLTSIIYLLNTEPFVGKDQIATAGHPAIYETEGKVELRFLNYSKNRFDESVFNESNYFTKNGDELTATGKYSDYLMNYLPSNK